MNPEENNKPGSGNSRVYSKVKHFYLLRSSITGGLLLFRGKYKVLPGQVFNKKVLFYRQF